MRDIALFALGANLVFLLWEIKDKKSAWLPGLGAFFSLLAIVSYK